MKQKLYLIAYDIADPRRLGRTARYLCQQACRVQYSVFAANLNRQQLETILTDLESIINSREDDIRVYPLPPHGEVLLLGQQFFATDALLVQNGHSRLELTEDSVS